MNHLEEWKIIKERYEYMLDAGFTKNITKEALQYRIECINSLIGQEDKEKDIAHFR